jgi:hypothetical protein
MRAVRRHLEDMLSAETVPVQLGSHKSNCIYIRRIKGEDMDSLPVALTSAARIFCHPRIGLTPNDVQMGQKWLMTAAFLRVATRNPPATSTLYVVIRLYAE